MGSFGRRPQDDGDSVSSMRERMDRDREAFFADRPTQGRPRPPFFQNAPTFDRNFPEADSLTSAFRSPRFGMGNFPGDTTDTANSTMQNNNMKHPRSNYQQKYSNSSSDADRHFPHAGDQSNITSTRPSSANNPDSIPIRVVYSSPK